jgi:Ca2+-binding EF-hand superfamily protein
MKFPAYVTAFLSIPTSVTDNDILPAFQVFDPEKHGVIEAEEILKSLTNVGEPLNEAEAKAFKDNIKINDLGVFDYNGRDTFALTCLSISNRCRLEFFLKFTQPAKPKKKKKGKKKKKSK